MTFKKKYFQDLSKIKQIFKKIFFNMSHHLQHLLYHNAYPKKLVPRLGYFDSRVVESRKTISSSPSDLINS